MKCSICDLPIILAPSASERAKKYGGRAEDYTALFKEHAQCAIDKHNRETQELIIRIYSKE